MRKKYIRNTTESSSSDLLNCENIHAPRLSTDKCNATVSIQEIGHRFFDKV